MIRQRSRLQVGLGHTKTQLSLFGQVLIELEHLVDIIFINHDLIENVIN